MVHRIMGSLQVLVRLSVSLVRVLLRIRSPERAKTATVSARKKIAFNDTTGVQTRATCKFNVIARVVKQNTVLFNVLKRLQVTDNTQFDIVIPNCWTGLSLPVGSSWQATFGCILSPVYVAYGWSNVADHSARADLYVSFDAQQSDNGKSATWILYQKDFAAHNLMWPTYKGAINTLGCSGVKIVVVSAADNNTFSCQFAG